MKIVKFGNLEVQFKVNLFLENIEEIPNGLFHKVKLLLLFLKLFVEIYKILFLEKDNDEVITHNDLFNEMVHVAAVK